ncbi:MAG TPA: protein kinase [Vicinamibacterales bacterium]|nr:protein kinase [Vicinamibacterales bacterium]
MGVEAGTSLGPYQIVSLLGAGGMGEVYRARDPRLGRDVAVKTIAANLAGDPEALARFQREARTIAALSHPNILAIYDIGSHEGIWYIVTELLQGETLGRRISRGRLPWKQAVEIAAAVADGLAAAHAHGVVHRDLKPENIFVTADDRIKILDFGLARQASADEGSADAVTRSVPTERGSILGTIGYMSPEQVQGLVPDARSDIFALGCVLHEMLSGRKLFQRSSTAETIAAILKDPAPPSSDSSAGVPSDLDRMLMRCLEKDRARRFQSAQDLAFALGTLATGPVPVRPAAAPNRASVAVLPFLNLSADPENEYFADGITEDVIAHLSKVRSLKVISRTSVMKFKKRDQSLREIGEQLGAATLLEGSVRRAGNRVRIVAQLVDRDSDEHLWAETYDRDLTDIFTIQTDVALQIAGALRAELSADERSRIRRQPTNDIHAYELYLHGRHQLIQYTAEGYVESVKFFERAVAQDPGFALAYADMAIAYVEMGSEAIGPFIGIEAYARARAAAQKALAIDDKLGEAHGAMGLILFTADFDWKGAERELLRALELNPGDTHAHDHYGWWCSAQCRFEESLRSVRRARELDPLAHPTDVATELLRAGRIAEALAEAQHIAEAHPQFPRSHALLGWALIKSGRAAEGVAALERAAALSPGRSIFLGQLGQAYAMTGATGKAREILRQLRDRATRERVPPYHLAYIHTGLDEQDEAIDWLERGYDQRAGGIYGVKGSFLFTSLHQHPRFKALLRKMNLE